MQLGTARKPAARNRASSQPANLDGTLSNQTDGPRAGSTGPPGIVVMSLRRNDSSTAFLSHWLTCQSSPARSAPRKRPSSSPASAASTASRTAPWVPVLSWSRISQADSMAFWRSEVMASSGSGFLIEGQVQWNGNMCHRRSHCQLIDRLMDQLDEFATLGALSELRYHSVVRLR